MSSAHLGLLKEICLGEGFLVVAFSGDGDSAYHDFLKPRYDVINSAKCWQLTFAQIVEVMSSHDELFVVNFLHVLKCVRNRLSI
jgi:hypothetical protein